MTHESPGGGLRRLLTHFLLASAVAAPAAASEPSDVTTRDAVPPNDDDELDDELVEAAVESLVANDPSGASGRLATLLSRMHPFDATRTAALGALSPNADVRRALAAALASRFKLVGAGFVLDQLSRDPAPDVRSEALRAIDARIGIRVRWPTRR